MPRPGDDGIAEPQRVQDRDRPGAHREDVAEDPADARRGALVRLDGARVVVRFDLERDREAVPDRDDTGVLARAGEQLVARRGGRQRAEQGPRALVRAVLGPHHAEHRQLELVRVPAAEAVANGVQLVVGHAEAPVEWLHLGRAGHRRLHERHRPPTSTGSRGLGPLRGALDERADDPEPVVRADDLLDRRLRVGHQAGHVARGVRDPGDCTEGAVGVRAVALLAGRRAVGVGVAEQDLAVALDPVELGGIGEEAALAVGDRHPQRPAAPRSPA